MFQDPAISYYGISSALTDILRTLVRHLWFRLVSPVFFINVHEKDISEYYENMDPDVKNLCRTVNIFLRAIRRVQHGSLDYIIKDIDDGNTIRILLSRDVLQHPTVKVMIPKFDQRYECPEELKHICRFFVDY